MEKYIYKHIINKVYKMLCWREENKKWLTLYNELLMEVSSSEDLNEEEKGSILIMLVPLKFIDSINFKQKVFEVMNYVENLRNI